MSVNGWDYLTISYGVLATLFISILFWGESNMFTAPIATVFTIGTIYCALQWGAVSLFKKIEAKNPKWKV